MKANREQCFSIACEDRIGSCADILNCCKTADCALKGLWGWGMEGQGHYMVVPQDAGSFQQAMKDAGYKCEPTECICVECVDQTGVFCDAANQLAEAGVNIDAVEVQAWEGTAGCYIWCAAEDMDRACQALGC